MTKIRLDHCLSLKFTNRVFSSELNEIISDPIITHIARRIEVHLIIINYFVSGATNLATNVLQENVFNRLLFNHLGAILFEGEIRKITVALTKMFPNSKVIFFYNLSRMFTR